MKITNIFTILIVLMASLTVTFAATEGSAIIDASLLSQTPDPANAGDTVEVRFSIENIGWATSNDLIVSIDEGFPFTVIGDNSQNIGKLLSGQNGDYKQVVKFNVKIDSSANAGSHDLTLIVKDGTNSKEFDFTIDVESQDSIEVLSIDKSVIGPGAQEELNFKIKNVGTANLENLKFSLTSEDNVLLPVLSDNSFHIDSLKVGEEVTIPFSVIASSSVTADLYSLNLKISYQDSMTGTSKEVTTTAGIYIGGVTTFDVVYDDESDGEYAFTIANVGANDATSVKVTVEDSSDWKVNSRSSEIIGNLNKGDYTTTSFELSSTKGGNINLKIDYTDTMGLRQSITKVVEMKITPTTTNMTSTKIGVTGTATNGRRNPMSNLASAGSSLGSLLFNGLIAVLVIVGLIFGFRTYRKRKVAKK